MSLRGVDAGWGSAAVLRSVSLQLDPGARPGVVGASGSGKSTLAALMSRFLDPHSAVGLDLLDAVLDLDLPQVAAGITPESRGTSEAAGTAKGPASLRAFRLGTARAGGVL